MAKFRYLDDDASPALAILVELPGGEVGEADSLVGAAALVFGPGEAAGYEDLDDAATAWLMREDYAEKIALNMFARTSLRVVVVDGDRTVFDPMPDVGGDMGDDAWSAPVVIDTASDRAFLLSLHHLGVIRLLEREDSHALRPHPSWDAAAEAGRFCAGCRYFAPAPETKCGGECRQYRVVVGPEDGRACTGFVPATEEFQGDEVPGAEYVEVPGAPINGVAVG